jgi:aryl-alcohol dehydrogenase-like predicted oxidoreductase
MSGNTSNSEMLYRVLGSTAQQVSAIGLGGWHIALKHVDEELGIRIVRTAIDRGITFMDNSWDYNGGESEIRMGKALRDGYRDKVFLMTKIDGRSHKEATRQIDESLQRLQVDCIDLVQHHEIIRYEDPHRVFHEEGANAALIEARKLVNSDTLALPDTKTLIFICICWKLQPVTDLNLIQLRCRLM